MPRNAQVEVLSVVENGWQKNRPDQRRPQPQPKAQIKKKKNTMMKNVQFLI